MQLNLLKAKQAKNKLNQHVDGKKYHGNTFISIWCGENNINKKIQQKYPFF